MMDHPFWTTMSNRYSLACSIDRHFLELVAPKNNITHLNASNNYAPSTLDLVMATNSLHGLVDSVHQISRYTWVMYIMSVSSPPVGGGVEYTHCVLVCSMRRLIVSQWHRVYSVGLR